MFQEKDNEPDTEEKAEIVDSDVEEIESVKDSDVEDEDESIKDSDLEEEEDDDEDEDEEGVAQKQVSAFLQPPDNDEDDEEEDEDYLQKFDDSIKQQIITDFHPELKTHNYDEIEVLSRVVRDNNGTIIDPLHRTMPFITKYEKARILGERAAQINSGAMPVIEVEADMIDGYIIALKEFEQKKIPFIVKRPIPNGAVEYWKLEDLEIL